MVSTLFLSSSVSVSGRHLALVVYLCSSDLKLGLQLARRCIMRVLGRTNLNHSLRS
jgi:hypothetical protein